MSWYTNLTTALKLMLAFGLMAALIGFVGYQGIQSSSAINGMLNELCEKEMVGVSVLKDARFQLATLSSLHRQSIIEKDPEKIQAMPQQGEAILRAMDEDLARAEKTVQTESAQNLQNRIRETLPEYRARATEVLRLSAAGQKDAALVKIIEGKPYRERVQNALEEWAALKDKPGRKAYEDSDSLHASLRRMLQRQPVRSRPARADSLARPARRTSARQLIEG